MRQLPIVLLFICFSCAAVAQTSLYIQGKVVDGESSQPLANSSVFISNTSKGTITDAAGAFMLSDVPSGQYDLIISCVGYETYVYSFSGKQLPLRLQVNLKRKATDLEGVTVVPYEKDGWQKWGKYFTDSFIGTSANASDCKLLNPQAVRFHFSRKQNMLEAIADEPLIIENKALGYRITYQLEQFRSDFSQRSVLYLGYPLFENMQQKRSLIKQRWKANRERAYTGSMLHFMRSLYKRNLPEEGFEVRRLFRKPNLEKERVKLVSRNLAVSKNAGNALAGGVRTPGDLPDSSEYYSRILRQPDFIDSIGRDLLIADSMINNDFVLFFKDYLAITFKNEKEEQAYLETMHERRLPYYQRSMIWLHTSNPVRIESNGSYFNPLDIYAWGYWAWSEKLGDMLPLDYVKPGEQE